MIMQQNNINMTNDNSTILNNNYNFDTNNLINNNDYMKFNEYFMNSMKMFNNMDMNELFKKYIEFSNVQGVNYQFNDFNANENAYKDQ